MSIYAINVQTTGLVGEQINPRRCTMITSDSLATITTAGYLNNENKNGNPILPTDVFDVLYSYNPTTKAGTFGMFTVSYSSSTGFSLVQWANPGDVLLPVVSGDFANFNGTTGQIYDAGFSPTDATKTKVVMLNAAPTINHLAIFTNANGTIGDGGVAGTAAAKAATNNSLADVASTAGSGFTIGHLISAADAAGTIQDTGIASTAVQLSANIKAATTGNIGGSGAGPLTVTVAGMTSSSVVVVTGVTSSNACYPLHAVPGTGSFALTMSADPGATLTVSYVAFIAPQ